jgi:putative FmdB family regulatory protein
MNKSLKEEAMPVFDYKCEECGRSFDVYHKVKEIVEDIVCPACGSKQYKKMMSRVSVSVQGGTPKGSYADDLPASSCDTCCNNGMCGMN